MNTETTPRGTATHPKTKRIPDMNRADIRRVLKILAKHPNEINVIHQRLLDAEGIDYTCNGTTYGFYSDEDAKTSGELRNKANAEFYAIFQKRKANKRKISAPKKKRKKN